MITEDVKNITKSLYNLIGSFKEMDDNTLSEEDTLLIEHHIEVWYDHIRNIKNELSYVGTK